MSALKQFIGDGVYADLNAAGQIVLTTENGVSITNTIFLEPEVWRDLVLYVEKLVKLAG